MDPTGRISGVMLPLFSLRSRTDFGIGNFGAAVPFLDWMKAAGQKLWMLLPLLPTAPGDPSPYATRCASGLNPLFIDLDQVPEHVEAGGVDGLWPEAKALLETARASHRVRYDVVFPLKWGALWAAFERSEWKVVPERREAFERFIAQEQSWLEPYALYAAVGEEELHRPWWEWPEGLRDRRPEALAEAAKKLERRIRFHEWLQWVAHVQWNRVREAARERGVLLCGDEPFIIGQDSADAWAYPHLLRRDARLGVPPDAFSATGQDWGLPYFDFPAMSREGYEWLRRRAESSARYYDLRRVDHAVGYFRQWIRDEQTPTGRFVPALEPEQKALGERHFRLLSGPAGLVAEDLGVVPPFAREVLADLRIPGYRVLRWEKDDAEWRNPHDFPTVSLVTTGTHDTETLAEWWNALPAPEREALVATYPELKGQQPERPFDDALHQALLASAENAKSDLCVIPWQDVLGSTERINLPGSQSDANWAYRMSQSVETLLETEETAAAGQNLRALTEQAGRARG